MSPRLIVVAYPKLSDKDFSWIQAVRKRNDGLSFDAISPHFTLFFPSNEFSQHQLLRAINRRVAGFRRFTFALRSAVLMPPVVGEYFYIFLVPDEGFSRFIKLHDLIYSGAIAKSLRTDIPFVPHLTVGSTKRIKDAKKLVADLNRASFEVCGAVDSLAIAVEDGNQVRTLREIALY